MSGLTVVPPPERGPAWTISLAFWLLAGAGIWAFWVYLIRPVLEIAGRAVAQL